MSAQIWVYSIFSVLIISMISFIGIFTISIRQKDLARILTYMVSFAAGALVGDAFIHLLPEIVEEVGFTFNISLYVLFGIFSMFVIEKFIHWHHCHGDPKCHDDKNVRAYAKMNLIGDGVHNFVDGVIIASSFLVSIPVGLATTIAVALHEIPQEIGDFGVLLHGGFKRGKALLFNFLSGVMAVVGAIVALLFAAVSENVVLFLVPLAAGHFIYIAVADLIPELHKELDINKSLLQLFFFVLGIAAMAVLLLLE